MCKFIWYVCCPVCISVACVCVFVLCGLVCLYWYVCGLCVMYVVHVCMVGVWWCVCMVCVYVY